MTVLEDLPDDAAQMRAHIRTEVRPDAEVVKHYKEQVRDLGLA